VAPKRKPVVTEAEEVSRLIGDIYDASLDPSLWSTVFAAATKYIGGVLRCRKNPVNFRLLAARGFLPIAVRARMGSAARFHRRRFFQC
jgi:hypothetical protein